MSAPESESVSRREKVEALRKVAAYNPKLTVLIVGFGVIAAGLEAVGLGFILPVIEIVQASGGSPAEADGVMGLFVSGYRALNVPFTLGTVIVGVAVVMIVRYVSSFLGAWFKEALRTYYIRYLQTEAFDHALNARVAYFDSEGSDDILNAIITQTNYAGRVIARGVRLLQMSLLSLVYIAVAFAISPELTIFTVVVLGGLTYLLRSVIEPGYKLGEAVADANQQRQEAAQAGTQGIREIRIFGLADELRSDFADAVNKYTESQITLRRNEAALNNFYNLVIAVAVFVLIFLALRFANLTLSSLGVFLFAMFQLGPKASTVNQLFYQVENDLPHLVRTQEFVSTLAHHKEESNATRTPPETVSKLEFDDVWFSYDQDTDVLRGIDFTAQQGEFVAFVGQSGAGKSTIAALLARMYEPDSGHVLANGEPIQELSNQAWRKHLAVVRQNPYIFNDTLRYNLTLANRNASRQAMEQVCEIAKVDEFFDDLPNGYDTVLGDDGVRLSGGQKQRVALARALLADADILVLDEATSDLDTKLEKEVQQSIEEMHRDYIIVTIAHRLSTVKNADRIYTVEDGEISEFGEHDELLSQGGTYAELYATQATG
ncbi:ABC transporter ATP-binding protein/permease [Halomicroarcula limicola]|uniref:ABC transporter ATP-binding protein/permease n=1 Tax=Haloarcula limicola TaxID=1429915 RepID=A0A8J7YEV3_9EURY|nr:ABC transporter ATP-binding protein [Halomicroarcula limicola]MBV0925208.1 ABC transporter ATP-binding protein/permease [Halomicroarcula limicola]